MPINISKVKDKQRSVTVSYGDEKATVWYNVRSARSLLTERFSHVLPSRSKTRHGVPDLDKPNQAA